MMSEALIILMNMRGGCATVGNTVHALFRVNDRRRRIDTPERHGERLGNEIYDAGTAGIDPAIAGNVG